MRRSFSLRATATLSTLQAPGGLAESDERFVFHDAAGTGTFVILHAIDPWRNADVYAIAGMSARRQNAIAMPATKYISLGSLLAVALFACGGRQQNGLPDGAPPIHGSDYCGPGTVWCVDVCIPEPAASPDCGDASPPSYDPSKSGSGYCGPGTVWCRDECVPESAATPDCGDGGAGPYVGPPCAEGQCTMLPYHPVDAEYSRALDRVVLVTDTNRALHLIDPHTGADDAIPLPVQPTAVSVAPDGTRAAVGSDSSLTVVDLRARSVVSTAAVTAPAGDVVLGAAFAYVVPSAAPGNALRDAIHIVDLASGAETVTGNQLVVAGSVGQLGGDGRTFFLADRYVPVSSLYRYDLSKPLQPSQTAMVHDNGNPVCGNLWPSRDGTNVYTACGRVFDATTLVYRRSFGAPSAFVSLDDTAADGTIAVLNAAAANPNVATTLESYEPVSLSRLTTVRLPALPVGAGFATSNGLFVCRDTAGARTFVVLHAIVPASSTDVYALAAM
jgi:hypothetical protein